MTTNERNEQPPTPPSTDRPTPTGTDRGPGASPRRRLAAWPVRLATTAVFLGFAAVFFATSTPFSIPTVEMLCGQPPPDVRFAPSGDSVHRFLTACGPDGRAAYRNMQLADLAYPAVFALFLASWLASTVERLALRPRPANVITALPLLGAAFDYLENTLAWISLAAFPLQGAAIDWFGAASAIKTVVFWVAGLILVAGGAVIALRGVRHRVTMRRARSGEPVPRIV